MADRPFGHVDEAALVMAAFDAGVKAPEVVGVLEAGEGLGTGYVMRRVLGGVSPAAILDARPPSLLGDLARELARISSAGRRGGEGCVGPRRIRWSPDEQNNKSTRQTSNYPT